MPAPSSEGAFDGQPQGLSLRHDIEFDLIATDNSYIFANFLGGSKPPPYHVVVCTVSLATAFGCLSLTPSLLLSETDHAQVACSVVNALTTAHCRYQLLRFTDSRKGCPYGMIYNSLRAKPPLLFTFHSSLPVRASPCLRYTIHAKQKGSLYKGAFAISKTMLLKLNPIISIIILI